LNLANVTVSEGGRVDDAKTLQVSRLVLLAMLVLVQFVSFHPDYWLPAKDQKHKAANQPMLIILKQQQIQFI
jgi:hypothetical protein